VQPKGKGRDMENETFKSGFFWFAVTTRSRQEKTAALMLEALGLQPFLPTTAELHQWSDRKQVVHLPLFPGYLFVHMNSSPEATLSVRKVPAIVDFVGNHNGPLPIPDCEIEDVRTVLARGVPCSPHTYLQAGDRVRVVRGALAGIEGTFVRNGSKGQLILSIEMMQRSLALTVLEDDVEPLAAAAGGISKSPLEPSRLAS
jgi:transcription antitermination factor NusG